MRTDVQPKIRYARKELFTARLIVSCVFLTIALSLYFYGLLNLPGVLLIILGALWNFFVDVNTFWAFIFSLFVGAIYAMFAVVDGLYANAVLYTLYYIPLQFITWIKYGGIKDISIKNNKRLKGYQAYYLFVSFIYVFIICFIFTSTQNRQILPALDTVSACALALSAFLQSFMFREYYFVRPIALVLVLELWLYTIIQNGISYGSLACILLYIMYYILDCYSMNLWVDTTSARKNNHVAMVDENGLIFKERIEAYSKLEDEKEEENEPEKNDDDNVIA